MSPYVAQPYVAGTPEAEVIGQTMISFAENMESDVIGPILDKHGLTTIDPDAWYSHQLWMDILKDIEDTLGPGQSQSAFIAFGRSVVENAVMPPEIQTIPDMLNALHAVHHANLRNIPEEEGYSLDQRGEQYYIVYHNTPNPDDAIYGFLWGLAGRFKDDDDIFVLERLPENDRPDIARSAFSLKWGTAGSDL
jgi:hypothetical protein